MRRPRPGDSPHQVFLDLLAEEANGSTSLEEKCRHIAALRGTDPELGAKMDRTLLEELGRLRAGLNQVQANQAALRQLVENLTAPPWHAAVFLGATPGAARRALVLHAGARRCVNVAADLDLASLREGDNVFLAENLNVILAPAPAFDVGETAAFERRTGNGRLVLRSRDEDLVVAASPGLDLAALRPGDLVRWDRAAWIALERIERGEGSRFFLEEAPRETFADVGGLGPQVEELQRSILLGLERPDIALSYHLSRVGGILLWGPPGNGKTLVAKALANWLGSLSRSGKARFINVKPGALHSVWYSQSEANYRELFRAAREAGERDPDTPVVLFFDEVDAIGAARGQSFARVDDRVITAFVAELDGLEARGNVLVIAATNRRDALDEALLRPGRLGDKLIEVPRPDRRGALEILRKHLPADVPYAVNGHGGAAEAREEILEAMASRIYSPNGEGELASLLFRDGKRRSVRAHDVVSGAGLANICKRAAETAAYRDATTGEVGVRLEDLLSAAAREFDAAIRTFTPINCRRFLADLPRDVDVVDVEVKTRRVEAARYLDLDLEATSAGAAP
jgi:proteasome-associated ATPase